MRQAKVKAKGRWYAGRGASQEVMRTRGNDRTGRKQPSRSPDEGQDSGRERISRAAYDLFSREGVRAVGVDAVIARLGTAKMTLYRNFPSKDDLIIEFLRRREQLWTQRLAESREHASAVRLLASSCWRYSTCSPSGSACPDFEGCSFLTTMIEINDREHPVHQAAVGHLANIRAISKELAAAGLNIGDIDSFARQWHILMKGAIMAAHEGDTAAAARARELASCRSKSTAAYPPAPGPCALPIRTRVSRGRVSRRLASSLRPGW